MYGSQELRDHSDLDGDTETRDAGRVTLLYLVFVPCGAWFKGQSSDVVREVESEKTAGGEWEQKETTPVARETEGGEEDDGGRKTGKVAPSPSDNVSTTTSRWSLSPCYLHTQPVKGRGYVSVTIGTIICALLHGNYICPLQQILQMTIVKNLDTGDSFPLSVVDEKIPLGSPLNLHLYRRTAAM